MSIITVEDAKAYLNITTDEDDSVIERLISAAESFTDRWIETPLAELSEAPDDLKQAVMMLVGHWYENRETSLVGFTSSETPFGFWDLIGPHRAYSFGA